MVNISCMFSMSATMFYKAAVWHAPTANSALFFRSLLVEHNTSIITRPTNEHTMHRQYGILVAAYSLCRRVMPPLHFHGFRRRKATVLIRGRLKPWWISREAVYEIVVFRDEPGTTEGLPHRFFLRDANFKMFGKCFFSVADRGETEHNHGRRNTTVGFPERIQHLP